MLIEKATAGILTNDPSLSQKASLTNPQLGVLGEQRLWLEYLFLQTIKLLKNNGSNLENVECSVCVCVCVCIHTHTEYILSIYLYLPSSIYPSIHPTLFSKVVCNLLLMGQCFSIVFNLPESISKERPGDPTAR